LYAIHGAGAFRSFKTALRRHRLESAWFEFRAAAIRQIALDWCEENDMEVSHMKIPSYNAEATPEEKN
jgi:hypothetical protein